MIQDISQISALKGQYKSQKFKSTKLFSCHEFETTTSSPMVSTPGWRSSPPGDPVDDFGDSSNQKPLRLKKNYGLNGQLRRALLHVFSLKMTVYLKWPFPCRCNSVTFLSGGEALRKPDLPTTLTPIWQTVATKLLLPQTAFQGKFLLCRYGAKSLIDQWSLELAWKRSTPMGRLVKLLATYSSPQQADWEFLTDSQKYRKGWSPTYGIWSIRCRIALTTAPTRRCFYTNLLHQMASLIITLYRRSFNLLQRYASSASSGKGRCLFVRIHSSTSVSTMHGLQLLYQPRT